MIYFNNKPNDFLSAPVLKHWLNTLCTIYKVELKTLHYNFVQEPELLKMNQTYLKHDTHTDIITFSYAAPPFIEAEIYISLERLQENAAIHKESTDNELLRLLSHGFLHCIGFNDTTKEEKKIMSIEEDRCINMFHVKQANNV